MTPNDDQIRAGLTGPVTALDPRLTAVLQRRAELVIRWVEAMAHGGEGAMLVAELIEVERLIAEGWPRVWLQHSRDWIQLESELIHAPGITNPACPTCRARAVGDTPEAA